MLTRNLVAALSCATFSLALSQSAAASTLTPDELSEMPEVGTGQQQAPAGFPMPEHDSFTPAQGGKVFDQMQAEAPSMPVSPPPAPSVTPKPPLAQSSEPIRVPPAPQTATSIEERREFYEQRYQDLRAHAKDAGVDMPAQPPWAGRGMGRRFMTDEERASHREAMRNMSPEERQDYRRQMHERMRERAWEEGVVLPEKPLREDAREQWQAPPRRPAWVDRMAEYRDRVSRMSPEDRAACQALTRMEMRDRMLQTMREMSARMQRMPEFMPRQYSQGAYGQGYPYAPEGDFGQDYPMAPGAGHGAGYPSPWAVPGAGYGSGPMAPFEDFGSGYPSAPGYGTGYGSPWGYDR